ncbi:disintegrin and metalloproteinase domain-containing protein 8-like [Mobula hypostoma]|uniref:disintegrin and metalloproteinase domain-containing protein 8-like n=1 Tax=Mobula hypostoma TaxID=723540 RepID=UPI002FC2A262
MPRYLVLLGFAICGRLLTSPWTGSPEPMPQSSTEGSGGRGPLAEKLLGEGAQYRIISPFIISGGQMRNMDHLQQNNYTDEVEIWMEIEEQHLTLDLRRNHFLIPERLQVSYYGANGTLMTEQSSTLTHCFYEGMVRGLLGSQVAANICSGLSGLIMLSNESYVIEHVERDGRGYHLLFGPKHLKLKEMKSNSKHLFSEHTPHPLRYQSAFSSKRKVLNRLANAANYVDLSYEVEEPAISPHL